MIDLKLIRCEPDLVRKNCSLRGYDSEYVDKILKIDEQWRTLKFKADNLRKQRNKISKEINLAKKNRDEKKAKELIKKAKEIPEKLNNLSEEEKKLKQELDSYLLELPNIISKDSPVGDESKNKVLKEVGKKPEFSFKLKPHWQIAEELSILDLDRSAKIAGAGFYIFKGDGARLQRALIQFMLDFHYKNKLEEINPPQLVKQEMLIGTGQLPKFEDQLYKTNEGLYMVPTAEVPVTNIYSNETLKEKELPKKMCAFTQCYRTEAGRHGAETRGIFRLHEFEKVEMVYLSREEDSWDLLEEMTEYAEKLIEKLKIPYRRLLLSTQDTGFASAKTYDIEVWSPFLKKYLETSSCSNCLDFQARRMNTRYQSKEGLKFIHTLNGSGLALPRLMIALIEIYQQKDGSIKIPLVLQPYMSGQKKIEKKK